MRAAVGDDHLVFAAARRNLRHGAVHPLDPLPLGLGSLDALVVVEPFAASGCVTA
jgi:hypothetical protein